jgi:hypothetical protein
MDAAGSSGNHNGTDIVRIDQHVQASADCTFILVKQVRRFCDTESFGTEFKSDCISAEHQRVVTKFETETEKLSVGYAAPVLWIDDVPPEIPDNHRTTQTKIEED